MFIGSTLYSQCSFTFSFFGSGTAPAPGNSAILQTCSFIGEAVTATNVVAGNTYCVDLNYTASGGVPFTPFVVVYDASFNPIASGFSPVSFTAPSNGTFYSLPFIDQFCGTFDPNFGCNSTLWSNITSGSMQTASSCISYTWPFNNQVYTTSGIYVDSVLTSCGYVSASLDLTIASNALDYTVTNSNGTLASNQSIGTYQWIDCQTNSIVNGATNQSFSPIQSGNYAVILTDSTGCSDTTSCFSIAAISGDTIVNCGTYTWPFNNQTYTTSGMYSDSVPTPIGYDYAFLDLTILSFTATDLTVIDSNSVLISLFPQQPSSTYQWIDCSSNNIPILGATSQLFPQTQTGSYAVIISDGVCSDTSACSEVFIPISDSVVACDSYTWVFNNQTYTNSGTYTDSIPVLGAYQLATLYLSVGLDSSNLQVIDSSGTLYSQSNLGSYQWIDCATNLPVNGATNQSFLPAQSGSFAVIVSDGVCSDTSACTTIQVSGLSFASSINLSIKPNPTHDFVTISYEGELIQLDITDSKGKLIYSNRVQNNEQIDLSSFETGVYFFNVRTSQGNEIHRIVRQ
ncbi:MAG: T9SS type A sorting domain-containing protein [Crocinitomicaceae bacterium]